jgi:hypothetical protein
VFGRNAAELLQAIEKDFGEVSSVVNAEKPRRGSFEISVLQAGSQGNLFLSSTFK